LSVYTVGTNKETSQGTLYKTNNFLTNNSSKTRISNRNTLKFYLHQKTVEGIPCLFIHLAQTKKQAKAHFTRQIFLDKRIKQDENFKQANT
jgi:hypothetical protein